jgi:S-adenosylmethionine/arginine decarboxylase-like enzyme
MGKTRKRKQPIQHHHLIVRCETEDCPRSSDRQRMQSIIDGLIADIDMKHLAPTNIYYMKKPSINEGMTAITPIETSHVSFHFWKHPDRSILHNKRSRCLLQMDVYTCGSLTHEHLKKVLAALETFKPRHVNLTLLNRLYGLSIERAEHWDATTGGSFATWLLNF